MKIPPFSPILASLLLSACERPDPTVHPPISPPPPKLQVVSGLLQDLGKKSPRALPAETETPAPHPESPASFVESSPAASVKTAAARALRLPAGGARNALLEQVVLGWAADDLPAALAWAEQLPADAPRSLLLASLGLEVARTDPLAALRIAIRLPSSPARDELFRHASSQWATTDAPAAKAWAEVIEEEPLRSTVLQAIAPLLLLSPARAEEMHRGKAEKP